MMNKADKHKIICEELNKIYKVKNHDYGTVSEKLIRN